MNQYFLLDNKIHSSIFSFELTEELKVRLFLTVVLFTFSGFVCAAQTALSPQQLFSNLKTGSSLPEDLLSTRSVLAYDHVITDKELREIQKSFRQTGIDAVACFETDLLLAGRDVGVAYANYFIRRDIKYMVFMEKAENNYQIYVTEFNKRETFADSAQQAWTADDRILSELLKKVYRACGSLTNQNFLINDIPETDISIGIFSGRRSDFYALDLKVDMLAVRKFGDETMDKELEEIFSIYPYKFKLTDPNTSERDLRKQGFLFVLYFVHARASVARVLLGYNTSAKETAYVSVTYPQGDEPQMKSIDAETPVYKFYFKHIESGNVFLGTKWDADTGWQQALKNQLTGFLTEVK